MPVFQIKEEEKKFLKEIEGDFPREKYVSLRAMIRIFQEYLLGLKDEWLGQLEKFIMETLPSKIVLTSCINALSEFLLYCIAKGYENLSNNILEIITTMERLLKRDEINLK